MIEIKLHQINIWFTVINGKFTFEVNVIVLPKRPLGMLIPQ